MYRLLRAILAVLLALGFLALFRWGLVVTAGAAAERATGLIQPTPLPNSPEGPSPLQNGEGDASAPLITTIDGPTAQCYRPEQYTNDCYIRWQYLNVTASTSQYIISMTVSIDNRIRAYYSGFFQSAMYVPSDMQKPGFHVACGLPGAGGNPGLGQAYSYIVRARETGGLKAANYGTVYCPADVVPVKKVNLSGPLSGLTNRAYTFTTTVPLTTTLPVTYTWTVNGQSPITVSAGVSDTQTFTWNTAGVKKVTVQAANRAGTIQVFQNITINEHKIYLPLLH